MNRAAWFTCPAVTLALAGMALPQLSAADLPARPASPVSTAVSPAAMRASVAPTTATPTTAPQAAGGSAAPAALADVALGGGGVLRGQVVDPQGNLLAHCEVLVRQQDRAIAVTRTDADGRFAISGLAGGVYQIAAAESVAVFRFWAPGTAPPAAQAAALIVAGNGGLVRGQGPGSGVRRFFSSPWVLAGLLAAAIATPIALSNRDKVSTS